eukprot:Gregarina_sp_Pseudo_9__1513@NODE_2016_length_1200_cov_507_836348_g1293_i2_p1_GENE_NODE_2016_length_1200_cov_507_836348_g1293_i2NODE_2016_length_1200_cov_507_836348_g1293_i2_p1_ORF_typecomplete_len277_score51_22_NODE_2016_length_1200_cov_507_836348_g1293_i23701146
MKFLTSVSGFLVCGVLTAEVPAQPTLTIILGTPSVPDDMPAECPKEAGLVTLEALQACYDSTQGYTGTFTYTGQVSAGAWSGNLCQAETNATPAVPYFSSESLLKHLPAWMEPGAATGTYTLTVAQPVTKACVVSFLMPTNPDADCVAPIEGPSVGNPITVPKDATSFSVQAPDFAESVKIAATSSDCTLADLGQTLASIDATNVQYDFTFTGGSTDTTPTPDGDSTSEEEPIVPGPEGASAHLIIGTLFVLSLVATL